MEPSYTPFAPSHTREGTKALPLPEHIPIDAVVWTRGNALWSIDLRRPGQDIRCQPNADWFPMALLGDRLLNLVPMTGLPNSGFLTERRQRGARIRVTNCIFSLPRYNQHLHYLGEAYRQHLVETRRKSPTA